ncbi:glycine oxidase ThiO [Labrenzia sp. VG12]|uniref:glycine oxidase ThiO n=1 Tax=Labrenzia sp. VG12 TaxID=2021862 RepID=UPI000B8C0905|nr:glycine oxidase ThiO [Labrenzia sp. VG12]ASP32461.1 glycine oxidase ThiO [Labrenzia sp. VG12]
MEVLVRGAGVAGLALARELLRRKVKVHLVDRRSDWSGSASWLAGGMLAPWCERENAEEPVLRFGKGAIDWWDRAVPGLLQRRGTLVVAPARDTRELDRFARRTSGYRLLDRSGVTVLEPELEGRFAKGLFFEGEAHLDPRAALQKLLDDLIADGVDFHVGSDCPRNVSGLTADCTGMAARDPDLRPVRGEMLILHAPDVHLARPVRLLHPRFPVYVVPREDQHFMIGATMIESGDDGPVTVRSTMELLNAAYSLHPGFAEARIVETGAGLRPAYADNLPRIRRAGDTIFVNGFYRHGFLLAPHFAGLAAHMITTQHQETRLEALH